MTKKGVTLYFMRHGETIFNRYNRMQGWSGITPLTKRRTPRCYSFWFGDERRSFLTLFIQAT